MRWDFSKIPKINASFFRGETGSHPQEFEWLQQLSQHLPHPKGRIAPGAVTDVTEFGSLVCPEGSGFTVQILIVYI